MKRAFSAALLLASSLAWAQRPSDEDIASLIERSRLKAGEYTQSLPDFLVTETVRRYGGKTQGFSTSPRDTLTVQLRYFQHKEDHKLVLFNGEPAFETYEHLAGLVPSGEFGTTLNAIFEPESQTVFHWESWKNVRGRRAAVFNYEVDGPHSRYRLGSDAGGHPASAVVSYHGIVECDAETGEVLHLEYAADRIPNELHLSKVLTSVDYAVADIGGREYLLPSRSETEMHSSVEWVKNVAEFREYRKFSAESTVDFGPRK